MFLRCRKSGFIRVVHYNNVFETVGKHFDDVGGNMRCFAVEADSMKTFGVEAHYVFFASRDEEDIAPVGQLFQPEAVVLRNLSAVKEAEFGFRAVEFHEIFSRISKYRFSFRIRKFVIIAVIVYGIENRK